MRAWCHYYCIILLIWNLLDFINYSRWVITPTNNTRWFSFLLLSADKVCNISGTPFYLISLRFATHPWLLVEWLAVVSVWKVWQILKWHWGIVVCIWLNLRILLLNQLSNIRLVSIELLSCSRRCMWITLLNDHTCFDISNWDEIVLCGWLVSLMVVNSLIMLFL
jgi:hypothetical protein